MTEKTPLPTLPDAVKTDLIAFKASDLKEFSRLVKALRLAEWPLRAIAEPFGVSRTAVQGWEANYDGGTLPEVPKPPKRPKKTSEKASKKATLTEDEAKNLFYLTQQASKVRRYTDQNAPSRRAAAQLEALLIEYTQRGVTKAQLAEYCGVSDSSIKQRLRKYS